MQAVMNKRGFVLSDTSGHDFARLRHMAEYVSEFGYGREAAKLLAALPPSNSKKQTVVLGDSAIVGALSDVIQAYAYVRFGDDSPYLRWYSDAVSCISFVQLYGGPSTIAVYGGELNWKP